MESQTKKTKNELSRRKLKKGKPFIDIVKIANKFVMSCLKKRRCVTKADCRNKSDKKQMRFERNL